MRIRKSIYGMMQAGQNWWKTLNATYKEMGFTCLQADQCVRSQKLESGELMTSTYTDNTLGGSSSTREKDKKGEIGAQYSIKDTDSLP